MANDVQYNYHTVQAGQDNTENTLRKIANKRDENQEIYLRLNPNYGLDTILSAGTKVLIGVGSMTDTYDGFATATLKIEPDGKVFKGIITDIKGHKETVVIEPNPNSVAASHPAPDISLTTIANNVKDKDKKWYKLGVPKTVDVGTLQKLNPWMNSQTALIPVGRTVLLTVAVPGTATEVDIIKFGILGNTTRTLYVAWDWDHEVNGTEGVEVEWSYQIFDGKWLSVDDDLNNPDYGRWLTGNKTKISDKETFESTYSPDENAIAARVRIKPYAKEGKNTAVEYEWCAYKSVSYRDEWKVATPSAPKVEIKNYKLTATYESLPTEETGVGFVTFEVVDEDGKRLSDRDYKYKVGVGGYVQASWTITAGCKYKVRGRCGRRYNGLDYFSPWSEYTNFTNSYPTPPKFKECKVLDDNLVQFKWSKVQSADAYILEYVLKDEEAYKILGTAEKYFETYKGDVTSVTVDAATANVRLGVVYYSVANIPYATYLARVKAVNEEESKYSEVLEFVLGLESDAPTTWSSATSVGVGEPLKLYWTHNTPDNSKETAAKITMIPDNDASRQFEIYVHKTTDNTLAKIAKSQNTTVYSLKMYNPDLANITNTTVLDPGTIVRVTALRYMFIEDDNEELTSYYTVNTDSYPDGTKLYWKVQTAGALKSNGSFVYGEESMLRTVDIYAPPTLSIDLYNYNREYLNDTLRTLPFYAVLRAGNTSANQTVTGYHVSIIAQTNYSTTDEVGNEKAVMAGSKVFSKYYDVVDSTHTIEFTAKDMTLKNNQIYKVVCIVSMSSGLTAEAESSAFSVAWQSRGYTPNAEVGVDKTTLTARIRPFAVDAGDSVNLFVYRREFDGSFTELVTDSNDPESGLENTTGTWITDPHPALDYARYRVVARDKATGIINYFDVPSYPVQEKSVVIQWDEKWQSFNAKDGDSMMENADQSYHGSMLKLPYNIDVSNTHSPDVSLVRYIGRKRPVSYYGTQLGETATWNVVIPKSDTETLYGLRRLAVYMGNVYVREPSGSGYWASISISFSQRHLDLTIPVTINITPVEGGI